MRFRCWTDASRQTCDWTTRTLLDDMNQPDDCVEDLDGSVKISQGRQVLRFAPNPAAKPSVWAELPGPSGALAVLPGGDTLVAVSGLGVVRLDRSGREVGRLSKDASGALSLGCVTAIAVGADGRVYLAQGSRHHSAADWRHDLMAAHKPSGAILVTDAMLGSAQVLLEPLSWPAGLALSADGRQLLFSESWAHTLKSLDLQSKQVSTLQPNLPGYPGRLQRDERGDYWMAVYALRTQLIEFVLGEAEFRKAMLARVPPALWIAPSLRANVDYRESLQYGSVKKLGIQQPWAPPRSYGLVARLNAKGEVLDSFHSRVDGHFHGVTAACPLRNGSQVIAVSKGHGRLAQLQSSASGAHA